MRLFILETHLTTSTAKHHHQALSPEVENTSIAQVLKSSSMSHVEIDVFLEERHFIESYFWFFLDNTLPVSLIVCFLNLSESVLCFGQVVFTIHHIA